MTLFGQKVPPELLIAAPAFNNGFFMNNGTFADGLIIFAIIAAMKKPWEYDN